jgi:hypothetical protein
MHAAVSCSGNYAAFARHLDQHHHVPPWRIPTVIVEWGCGWVFYG